MKYSYTSVGTFAQCPRRWKYQYVDKLKTLPDTAPDNALWLGLALHKGIEEWSVDAAIEEYKSHYNIITDDNINWMMQLEYQLPRVLDILPNGGEHEIGVETSEFVGYIDYIVSDTIYDFKFTNNIDNYLESPQLAIYKHYLKQVRPELQINHIKFLFVPKVMIRQKKDETLMKFRERLKENLEATEIKVIEVSDSALSVAHFREACQIIDDTVDFPKNESRLCNWCPYQKYCQSDGKEDWMIL